MKLFTIIAICITTICLGQTAKPTGEIAGQVVDEQGKPYTGSSRIVALPMLDLTKAVQEQIIQQEPAQTLSSTSGGFTLAALSPGKYELCVQPLNGDYVDPCEWGKPSAQVVMPEGGKVAVNVPLTKGKMVYVEVDDPQALLQQHLGKSDGAFLQFMTRSPNGDAIVLRPGQPVNGKRTFYTFVPVATKFRVEALSGRFEVVGLDDSPATLQTALSREREFADGEAPQKIEIKIKSLKALEVQK